MKLISAGRGVVVSHSLCFEKKKGLSLLRLIPLTRKKKKLLEQWPTHHTIIVRKRRRPL